MTLLLAPKKIPIGFNFVEQESCVRLLNKPVERVPSGIPAGLVLEGVVAPIIFFDAVRLIAFSMISSSAVDMPSALNELLVRALLLLPSTKTDPITVGEGSLLGVVILSVFELLGDIISDDPRGTSGELLPGKFDEGAPWRLPAESSCCTALRRLGSQHLPSSRREWKMCPHR